MADQLDNEVTEAIAQAPLWEDDEHFNSLLQQLPQMPPTLFGKRRHGHAGSTIRLGVSSLCAAV